MNWYYVEAGQQMGPVDDAGLSALVASGRVGPDTLVWREGMANWMAYREVQPLSTPSPAAPTPPVFGQYSSASPTLGQAVCAECGNLFPVSETIQIGQARVCANCKPVFVQKMREGVPTGFAGGGVASEEQILARPYVVELGEAINRGWSLFTANAGIMIGTLILVGLVAIAFAVVGAVVGQIIPFANQLIQILYSVPLTTGLLWLSLRLLRGESAEVGDGFAGFKGRYLQLVGVGAIQFLFNVVCVLPVVVGAIVLGVSVAMTRRGQAVQSMPPLAAGAIIGLVIALVITVCAVAYVNINLTFAPLLVLDKNYSPWQAIQLSWKAVRRGWWRTFGFVLVGGLLYGAGLALCCIGALVTGPLFFNMKAMLYEDNFRDLAPRP